VVMLDRSKLAAPLFAQAAAFVVVLVIGGFTGHASTTAGPVPSATPSARTSTSTSASASATTGPSRKLTVKVVAEGIGPLSVSGSPVKVLADETLTSVVSRTLPSSLEFAMNVPAGQYQVCVLPPAGWVSAVGTTHVLADWICSPADVTTGPQLVMFRLKLEPPSQVTP
jgi:hypothetical protein